VITGPVEATAIGNLLMQASALGLIANIYEGRELVRRSFELQTFEPADGDAWDGAYARFVPLIS
jgi:rhamnulokinase